MRNKLSDKWFYSDVPFWLKCLQVYVKGDLIIILPFLPIILLIALFNVRLALIVFLVFFTLRQIGEMFYWLLQQFFNTGYRPYDFGFKNVGNKAIYIIFQLFALIGSTIGLSLLLYILF